MIWALLVGCADEGPPNLLLELVGRWTGELAEAEQTRPTRASFAWSDDIEVLTGEVVIEEGDGERTFELLEAVSVEELGVGLAFAEVGGVHELFFDALTPLDPFVGVWRDEWYCGDEAGGLPGFCQRTGTFALARP